jgi:hypothetical protein
MTLHCSSKMFFEAIFSLSHSHTHTHKHTLHTLFPLRLSLFHSNTQHTPSFTHTYTHILCNFDCLYVCLLSIFLSFRSSSALPCLKKIVHFQTSLSLSLSLSLSCVCLKIRFFCQNF